MLKPTKDKKICISTELRRLMKMKIQSFLEWQYGIELGIDFPRVHRIGTPHGDGSPRAIIAQFLR